MSEAIATKEGFGGFVGLEPLGPRREHPFPGALLLTSGRACLGHILDRERPRRVLVPFHSCDALLAPMVERRIRVTFYGIDEQLLPIGVDEVIADELIVLTDFFGVRSDAVRARAIELGPRAVIDSTHAYFTGAPPAGHYAFNSVRKFRGTPDGGFLFAPGKLDAPTLSNADVHGDHLVLRNTGSSAAALAAYRTNEERQSARSIGASTLTRELLHHYDHAHAFERRAQNFAAAHTVLGASNKLTLPTGPIAPLCYPLLLDRALDLALLHEAGIFAARYWPEVLSRSGHGDFPVETSLAERLIAFPIDQRYTPQQITERAWQLTPML